VPRSEEALAAVEQAGSLRPQPSKEAGGLPGDAASACWLMDPRHRITFLTLLSSSWVIAINVNPLAGIVHWPVAKRLGGSKLSQGL